MRRSSYTDEELVRAFETSISQREMLLKLGLKPAGSNYSLLQRRMLELHLEVSALKGNAWRRGSRVAVTPARPLQQILVKGVFVQSYKLKKRLMAANLLQHKCANCGLNQWLGQPVPLELDHRNGDVEDNRLENLSLLCPNCHALTPTYRGKNIGRRR